MKPVEAFSLRILFAGPGKDEIEERIRQLRVWNKKTGAGLQIVTEGEEADYLCYIPIREKAEKRPPREGAVPGKKEWDVCQETGFLKALQDLTWYAGCSFQRAILLSDSRVYGKIYGDAHPLTEEEQGYLIHTDPNTDSAWKLRMLERLWLQLAQEEGLSWSVARLPSAGAELSDRMIEELLQIFFYGKNEIYNLSSQAAFAGETASPLKPIPLILDARKVEHLHE